MKSRSYTSCLAALLVSFAPALVGAEPVALPTVSLDRCTADDAARIRFLEDRLAAAVAAGISEENVCLDPGFGFGKTPDQNLALIRGLERLCSIGRPVLVGLSRKSTLALVLGDPHGRVGSTAASVGAAVAAYDRGAALFRAHDVAPHVEALAAAAAVERGRVA